MTARILADTPIRPARATKADGSPRLIGAEVEFAALDCEPAARIVAERFGGAIERVDPYRYIVDSTSHGRFVVELDTQFVHPDEEDDATARADKESEHLQRALEDGLRMAIGEFTRMYLPVEVICPPLPVETLPELDGLVADLRAAGARGTRDSMVYAFGLQLNIDVPALDAATLLAYLRAYLVAADWLRDDIGIDLTRRVLPFIQPFPRPYLRRIMDPAYTPDLQTLIRDYLADNATRNRDLDMLPLFAWLDPERVHAAVDDPRLKARPAVHYRLPDSRVDDPDWRLVHEWNRWAATVEDLVTRPADLTAAADAYRRHLAANWIADFADEAQAWLRP